MAIMIMATYCLDEDDLIEDLNILWVARQLCPQEDEHNYSTPNFTAGAGKQLTAAFVIPRLLHPD